MKITCDYCGAYIDTDKNSSCPKCGGGFGNDSEIKGVADSYKEDMYLQEQVQMKAQQLKKFEARQKELDGQVKKVKIGCVVFTVLVLAVVIITVGTLIQGISQGAVMLINNNLFI